MSRLAGACRWQYSSVPPQHRPPSRTRIKQHAEVWLQQVGKAVEEPAVRVQLAAVGGLGGKHDLQRRVAVQARMLLIPARGGEMGDGWVSRGCKGPALLPQPGHQMQQVAARAAHLAVYSNRCMDVGSPTASSWCRLLE